MDHSLEQQNASRIVIPLEKIHWIPMPLVRFILPNYSQNKLIPLNHPFSYRL